MAKKKTSTTTTTEAAAPAAPAIIIPDNEPKGWVDQLLAKMQGEKLEELDAKDPAAARFIEKIAKRRKEGDRNLTAAELNKIHFAGVAVGLRR